MMDNFFPPNSAIPLGPGSQTGEADAELDYLPMPGEMHTFQPPLLPEPEDVAGLTAGRAVLESVLRALRDPACAERAQGVELAALDAANLAFVDQALGEGEVAVMQQGANPIEAQESVLAGVWRVRHFDAQGGVSRELIEIGAAPALIADTFAAATPGLETRFDADDPAIQNAPALLVELADRIRRYRAGQPAHTLNLSLLPLTEGDLALLGERLGVGPVTILSRGYGNCRIGSTARPNVWWIKYYNAQEVLILNTIEVVDLPLVAQAAAEDLADSAERLDEMLALYR